MGKPSIRVRSRNFTQLHGIKVTQENLDYIQKEIVRRMDARDFIGAMARATMLPLLALFADAPWPYIRKLYKPGEILYQAGAELWDGATAGEAVGSLLEILEGEFSEPMPEVLSELETFLRINLIKSMDYSENLSKVYSSLHNQIMEILNAAALGGRYPAVNDSIRISADYVWDKVNLVSAGRQAGTVRSPNAEPVDDVCLGVVTLMYLQAYGVYTLEQMESFWEYLSASPFTSIELVGAVPGDTATLDPRLPPPVLEPTPGMFGAN